MPVSTCRAQVPTLEWQADRGTLANPDRAGGITASQTRVYVGGNLGASGGNGQFAVLQYDIPEDPASAGVGKFISGAVFPLTHAPYQAVCMASYSEAIQNGYAYSQFFVAGWMVNSSGYDASPLRRSRPSPTASRAGAPTSCG